MVDIDDLILDVSFVVFTCAGNMIIGNMIIQSLIMLDIFL